MKSILVIADDFTGAAELAGIGARHGIAAQLLTEGPPSWRKGLTVVDADTRYLSPEEAARKTRMLLSGAGNFFDLIFKKNDSVLRGRVREELEAAMSVLGRSSTILIPQNPSRGRIVRAGEYRVNNIPLHATSFANDPEYPARSSKAVELLSSQGQMRIRSVEPGEGFAEEGIALCSAWDVEGIRQWAAQCSSRVLPAGGGDFFEVILERAGFRGTGRRISSIDPGPTLFVCGSASAYGREVISRAESRSMSICRMPDEVFASKDVSSVAMDQWIQSILAGLSERQRVLLVISQPIDPTPGVANQLVGVLAHAVAHVLAEVQLENLLMEGGATAAAVCRRMGWTRFTVVGEMAPGVVQMQLIGTTKPPAKRIIVKPGSYQWPAGVWW